jgi:crossover junction endodeoxyribonuclease RusA
MLTKKFSFFVAGHPVAKGSLKAFINRKNGRPILTHTNAAEQKAWASAIAFAAQKEGLKPAQGCAISLRLAFRMKRPKAHHNTKGEIRESMLNAQHASKPDIDKLIRMVMDSLTGIAYMDDSQVTCIEAEKTYADTECLKASANAFSHLGTGALITICQPR